MNQLNDFALYKSKSEKITMIACYDYWSAKILAKSSVDTLLVGDSVAMVVYGHNSTLHATMDMMVAHTEAVRRGCSDKFLVADMPFLSFRHGPYQAVDDAGRLMKAGANAVKIEGTLGHLETIQFLIESGIPVMGHLGLTPQYIHTLGGFKVQGKKQEQQTIIKQQALDLESVGCFSIVLECVPSHLGKEISQSLSIPTIGIGAGPGTDGQVLVLHDLMGLDSSFYPKFLKKFGEGHDLFLASLNRYHDEVKQGLFPSSKESFS